MDRVALVDLLQGTASEFTFSHGNTLPLITRPFAMTSWSSQTNEGRWLFHPAARQLQGIRATRQPSPWIGDYGHFVLMPQTGRLLPEARQRSSVFRPDQTVYLPHYFKTFLGRYRVAVELAPTERCAILRLTFPAEEQCRLILGTFAGESSFMLDSQACCLRGYTQAKSGGVAENFASYFVVHVDCPILTEQSGFFGGGETFSGRASASGDGLGAYVGLQPPEEGIVHVRVGTSFIGWDQAEWHLKQELGEAPFDSIAALGRAAWNEVLSVVDIEGASEDQVRTFYSALYRSVLFRHAWHEPLPSGEVAHRSPYDGQVHSGVLYTDQGPWDVYRTQYPLLSILFPQRLAEILQGWVNAYEEGGWFPKWASAGYRACMIGTHIDAIIADAYVKGIRAFDVETAYEGTRKHAFQPGSADGAVGRKGPEHYLRLGYVPADLVEESVSRTLDFAYNDFCIAQVARGLGRTEDYELLIARATNYRNAFDPGVGFMRGRNADGSWVSPFRQFAWGGPYVEGGGWQCGWAVQHDPAGLIASMGGKEQFLAKLDSLLATPPFFEVGSYNSELHEMTEMAAANLGQYAHSHQPSHHVLYLFAAAGAPWKTQYWVRRVLTELYGPGPDGFCGDEDNGEMAAWYIFRALGFYPLCPGHPSYVLGSPLFRRPTMHLASGKTFTVFAPNNDSHNVYVRRVALNGPRHRKSYLSHEAIVQGGELRCIMSRTPRAQDDGELEFPFSLSTAHP
ncbi:MAG: GH92 family glycosyl hydrolase [Candidatus Oleimicrobiaceae bacterium]